MGDNRLPRAEAFVYEGCLTHTLVKEAQCRDLKLEGEAIVPYVTLDLSPFVNI
mgnify:CR=1 FL=1